MQYLPLIGTVTLIHLLAVISPGPDFFMALKNSLTYSRKTGIWTAIGFSLGIAIHITYCVAGLALIISQSILLFSIIKYLGAIYLIYVGIKSIKGHAGKIETKDAKKKPDISPLNAIKMGFLTNILNPKATLFFLSLFTLVISPNTPALILVILSIIMVVNTALWFSLVAILFTHQHVLKVFNKFQNVFNKTLGGILILLGIKIALSQNK